MSKVKSLEAVKDGSQTIYDVTAQLPKDKVEFCSQDLDEAVIEGLKMAASNLVCFKDNNVSWVVGEKMIEYRQSLEPGTTFKFLLYDLNLTPSALKGEECLRCQVSFRGANLKGRLTAYLASPNEDNAELN